MTVHLKLKYIQSGKFKLGYIIEGDGDCTALIIGSSRYYSRTFSRDLSKHLKLVFVDHRGFAKSKGKVTENDFKLDLILDDIEKVRQKLNLDKIIIIGHSGHGFMALEYAKKYSTHVSHVVLISMGPNTSQASQKLADEYFNTHASVERKAAQSKKLETLQQELDAHPEKSFITFCLKLGPRSWYDYNYDANALWKSVNVNMPAFDYLWGKVFAEIDITNDLEHFDIPVLLVLGKHDYLVAPYYTWDNIKHKFKKLTIKVFDKSSHTPQLEESARFDKELLGWLSWPK